MKRRVLVVDDDPKEMSRIEKRLAGEGCDILTASTGGEAIEKAFSEKPDTVILEAWLPDMTGFDVCRLIKEARDFNARVIMTSSVVYDADEARAKEAGADRYVVKRRYF